jgi:RNA polymerase sigma factor (sigma-70 family)
MTSRPARAREPLGLTHSSTTNSLLADLNVDLNVPGLLSRDQKDTEGGGQSRADPPALDLLQITAAIRTGNEAAFQIFYEHYCDRLYRYLLVLTSGNEDVSRELMQITMTKVVRAMKPIADERSFWSWLSTIARNAFLDACRKSRRQPSLVPLSASELDVINPPAPADEDSPLLQALDDCLAALEPGDRELIRAFYFGHASQQAIAQREHTTPKAVESKLARIRQKLRENVLRRLRHEDT